jgi:hypothetical protein
MPNSEQTNRLMMGVPKDDERWLVTQLMYNTIDTLGKKPAEIVMKINAPQAWQQQQVDYESIELLGLATTQGMTNKRNAKQTWKSLKSRGSGSECVSSNSEDEM